MADPAAGGPLGAIGLPLLFDLPQATVKTDMTTQSAAWIRRFGVRIMDSGKRATGLTNDSVVPV
jgi:hypothetical protein